jgi:hypothetical protein
VVPEVPPPGSGRAGEGSLGGVDPRQGRRARPEDHGAGGDARSRAPVRQTASEELAVVRGQPAQRLHLPPPARGVPAPVFPAAHTVVEVVLRGHGRRGVRRDGAALQTTRAARDGGRSPPSRPRSAGWTRRSARSSTASKQAARPGSHVSRAGAGSTPSSGPKTETAAGGAPSPSIRPRRSSAFKASGMSECTGTGRSRAV